MVSIQILSLAFSHLNVLFASVQNWDTSQGSFSCREIDDNSCDLKYTSMGLKKGR